MGKVDTPVAQTTASNHGKNKINTHTHTHTKNNTRVINNVCVWLYCLHEFFPCSQKP